MIRTSTAAALCLLFCVVVGVVATNVAASSKGPAEDILARLESADEQTRLEAISEVRDGQDSQDVPVSEALVSRLIELMYSDTSDSVRYEAEKALRSVGGQLVGDALVAVVGADFWKYEDWMRLKAVTVLGDIGQFGVEGLVKALNDPYPRVQVAAAKRLQKASSPPLEAVVGLARLLVGGVTETMWAARVALEELATRIDLAEVAQMIVLDSEESAELRKAAAEYLLQQGVEVDVQIAERAADAGSYAGELGIDFEFRADMSAADIRPRPVTDFDVRMRFSVEDFGAKRDSEEDSLPAVQKALEAAKRYAATIGPCEVYFPKGQYHFAVGSGGVYLADQSMSLTDAKDIIIDGNGSEITIHSPLSPFLTLINCRNVIVRNFEIDYDPLPFSEGTVIDVDRSKNTVTVELFPGMPSPLEPYFSASIMSIQLKDPDIPGRLKANVPNWYETTRVERLDDRVYEMGLSYSGAAQYFSRGDIFVQNARGVHSLLVSESEDIVLSNITAYSSPGCFIIAMGVTRLGVIDCRLLLKEGRHTTACADGLHLQRNIAPWIEGCRIEAQGDDGLNLYSLPLYVLDKPAANKIELTRRGDLRVGDTLHHWDGGSATSHGSAVVVELEHRANSVVVTLDRDFPNMRPSDLVKQQMARGEFERDSRAQSFYRDLFGKGFVIINNEFINCRRFSLQLQAHDGIIEGNVFEGSSAQAVALRNASEWPEGHIPYNIIVRNNVFRDNGVDDAVLDRRYGQLFVEVARSTSSREARNIVIEGNTFSGANRPISIRNARDMVIRGNQFVVDDVDKLRSGAKVIRVERSENVEVTGNTLVAADSNKCVTQTEVSGLVDLSGGGNAGIEIR
jgi:HEAT repeat protein